MVMGELVQKTEILVIGGGPGGYAAAFRAADLGLDVTLVELNSRPGGVCLFRGCIPSKTYLYLSELLYDAQRAAKMGIAFSPPAIDIKGIRSWKAKVVDRLANGLVNLSEKRGIQILQGRAAFENPHQVRILENEVSHIEFRSAIIATGSHPISLPDVRIKKEGRIMSSTGALELADIPKSLLVIGGGYVGLELGSVYASLGSQVTLIEKGDRLLPGVDNDLLRPLNHRLKKLFTAIRLQTGVTALTETSELVQATLESTSGTQQKTFDRALIAIGRKPNTKGLGLENTSIELDPQGFIVVDEQQRTTEKHIFAVGDVAGGLLLAHKASREGKIAAEVIAGQPSAFDARAIPAVVYTDPQIAWCGLTEIEAKAQNRSVRIERFPWQASGRAVTMDATDGLTKIIVDAATERILGVGIAGRHVEGLIAEGVLAIEMGAVAEDMALSIHPHPTLSETESEAAEIFLGSATHILAKKVST